MRERQPVTKSMNVSQARQQFSQVLNQVFRREARVIVEKNGIPVAALISVHDLERLDRFEAQRIRDFATLDEIGEALKDVPQEEIEREVAKAINEVREENQRQQHLRNTG